MKFQYLFLLLILIITSGCNKYNAENWGTLKKLYKTYENGSIAECTHNGETVYTCVRNAYDASQTIFDADGNKIGSCNYAWGGVDATCSELQNCEVIYRIEDNIWGQPSVDKYGLGN